MYSFHLNKNTHHFAWIAKKTQLSICLLIQDICLFVIKMSFSMSEGVKTKVRINKRCGCVPLPVDKMCQQGIPKQITLDRTVQISWNGGVVCPIQYFTMIRTINNKFATAPFLVLETDVLSQILIYKIFIYNLQMC